MTDTKKISTFIYRDAANFVLFGWRNEGRHEFSFDVSDVIADRGRMQSTFLCLELFDHSSKRTHKYFRGAAYIPLSDIDGNGDAVREARLKRIESLDCPDYKELVRRRKSRASLHKTPVDRYLTRIEAHQKQSKIMMKFVNSDWIAVTHES